MNQHVHYFDLQPQWFPAACRYTLKPDGRWYLTSIKFCHDGVRWSSFWKRVRMYGYRWVRSLERYGVVLSFPDSEEV